MAKKQQKRRRRPREPEYQSYIFRIEDWESSYSFALNHSRYDECPYWEHLELSLGGEFLSPDKAKNRRATLSLLADRRLTRAVTNPASCDRETICVGTLTIRGDRTKSYAESW